MCRVAVFVVAVLLAPYGLTGVLTGKAYSDSDPKTQKLSEDWRRYFYVPPPPDHAADDDSHVPLFVEVLVGMKTFSLSDSLFCYAPRHRLQYCCHRWALSYAAIHLSVCRSNLARCALLRPGHQSCLHTDVDLP